MSQSNRLYSTATPYASRSYDGGQVLANSVPPARRRRPRIAKQVARDASMRAARDAEQYRQSQRPQLPDPRALNLSNNRHANPLDTGLHRQHFETWSQDDDTHHGYDSEDTAAPIEPRRFYRHSQQTSSQGQLGQSSGQEGYQPPSVLAYNSQSANHQTSPVRGLSAGVDGDAYAPLPTDDTPVGPGDALQDGLDFPDGIEQELDEAEISIAPTDIVSLAMLEPTHELLVDFTMAFGLWCETHKITTAAYSALLQVLRLVLDEEHYPLPRALSSLKQQCRKRLPVLPLCRAKVSVSADKMPTSRDVVDSAAAPETDAYFYDPRLIVAQVLSDTTGPPIYEGMAHLVDSPSELWHSRAWASSIRTVGQHCARMADGSALFPSDFVDYKDPTVNESNDHQLTAQVQSVWMDRRPLSPTNGLPLVTLRPCVRCSDIEALRFSNTQSDHPRPYDRVMLLCSDTTLPLSCVYRRRPDISIQWGATRPSHRTVFTVQYVYEVSHGLRPVIESTPCRGELEVRQYGRTYLESMVQQVTRCLPLNLFIDEFGLYRNMYRALTGIYVMPSGLSVEDRQKRSNGRTLTLGPHGTSLDELLRVFQTSLVGLEGGCKMEINGIECVVFAPILMVLGDMKGQQASAGFMGSKANVCCRFCDASISTRADMQRSLVKHGRYHFQVQKLRADLASIISPADRKRFCTLHGIADKPSYLQALTPALDIVMSRPPDPAHSEFYGIVRRLYPLLYGPILRPAARTQFTREFQQFALPSGWGRIQSPAHHMGSWSMSECAKASVIVPIILRIWLRPEHIGAEFGRALIGKTVPSRGNISTTNDVVDLVVHCFSSLARSNSAVSAHSLSLQEQANFHQLILDGRADFLLMADAAATVNAKHKEQRTKKTTLPPAPHRIAPGSAQAVTVSSSQGGRLVHGAPPDQSGAIDPGSDSDTSSIWSYGSRDSSGPSQNNGSVPIAASLTGARQLPNYHVALHFDSMRHEYGTLWNANVFWGEDKHRIFKDEVTRTNHQNPVRDLMSKEAIYTLMRSSIKGGLHHTSPEVSGQLKRIYDCCPLIFAPTLSVSDKTGIVQGRSSGVSHFVAHGVIRSADCTALGLPATIDKYHHLLRRKVVQAMADVHIHTVLIRPWQLRWYRRCSYFLAHSTRRRICLIGGFVRSRREEQLYYRIKGILGYRTSTLEPPSAMFLYIERMADTGRPDKVLGLPVMVGTGEDDILPLDEIDFEEVYMIPRPIATQSPDRASYWNCTWRVHFQ